MLRAALIVLLAALIAVLAQAHEWQGRLPLGDGKLSAMPERGSIMSCQTRFSDAPGASRSGDWIENGTWDPHGKPVVQGEVSWPNSQISIAVEGDRRVIRANNLPKHATGEFPIRPGTPAFDFDPNPNHIGTQDILFSIPASPSLAPQPNCIPMGMIGFAVTGAAIYNALDAGGRDAPAHEIQDRCNGHPDRSSQYHYHNWSSCLTATRPDEPLGWMLDGFPILGPVDDAGKDITNADLDDCHGRVGPVWIDGHSVTMYHYHFTREYPYSIGCFRGGF
jgi:hypothetical protein